MRKLFVISFCAVSSVMSLALADPPLNSAGYIDGESILFDPKTGNYTVTYYGDSPQGDRFVTLIYDTPNKVKPAVREQMHATRGRDIAYRYEVSNDKTAKQDIYSFGFLVKAPWWENAGLVTNFLSASQSAAGNMPGTAMAIESTLSYKESVEATRMLQSDKWLPEVSFAKN